VTLDWTQTFIYKVGYIALINTFHFLSLSSDRLISVGNLWSTQGGFFPSNNIFFHTFVDPSHLLRGPMVTYFILFQDI